MLQQETPSFDPIGAARDNAYQALPDMMARVDAQAPRAGRHIKIVRGKHKGIIGRVTWHGVDRFSDAGRYGNDLQNCMRIARGRYGFRIRVEPDNGSAAFFCDANYAEILNQNNEAVVQQLKRSAKS